jgi:hypothetical protein
MRQLGFVTAAISVARGRTHSDQPRARLLSQVRQELLGDRLYDQERFANGSPHTPGPHIVLPGRGRRFDPGIPDLLVSIHESLRVGGCYMNIFLAGTDTDDRESDVLPPAIVFLGGTQRTCMNCLGATGSSFLIKTPGSQSEGKVRI